jgi:hypothetical protein
MFSAKKKQSPGEIPGAVTSLRSPKTVGRERLRFIDGEVSKAKEAVADLENRIERFESIISDADANHRALQLAIANDGGKALAEYAAGKAGADSEIAKLVTLEDSSRKAATAAKAALPGTESMLNNARAQLPRLAEERVAELNRVVARLADADARAYQKAFEEMCRLHDRLVGYASVAQATIGDIQLIIDPVKTPRFALPSMGNSDADPFLRHSVNELTVNAAAKSWAAVRQRLEDDAEADLSDLI